MRSLLYLSPNISTFVKKDIEILSSEFNVKLFQHFYPNGLLQIKYLLLQPIRLIRSMRAIDCMIVMFGGLWAVWPVILCKLLNKPIAIILGGTDCVSFPHLHYGYFSKWYLKPLLRFVYKYADFLIPVHDSLVVQENTYDPLSIYKMQGYKAFLPENTTPYQVVHNGYQIVPLDNTCKKKNQFLSIIPAVKMNRAMLKGLPEIIGLANKYQEYIFIVIGCNEKIIAELDFPPNLNFIPFLPFEELEKYFIESQYYLQLSISEGFPNALCEAMMYECIPIGSNVGGIPTIIDKTGFIIKSKNQREINEVISNVLSLSDDAKLKLGINARKRIIENFPLHLRKEKLISILNKLIRKQ